MPGTKRIPVSRTPIPQITPKAIQLFEAWKRASGKRECDLEWALLEELHGRPWQWPFIINPRHDTNPYPPGCNAHRSWQPNLEAQQRWRQLEAALQERRKAEREARKAASAVPKQGPDQPSAT
jgi:hypothetical protein